MAAMVDEIVGRAAMEAESDRFMMTARLEIRYRKPVPVGVPLRLIGRLAHRRGRARPDGEEQPGAVAGHRRVAGTVGRSLERVLNDLLQATPLEIGSLK